MAATGRIIPKQSQTNVFNIKIYSIFIYATFYIASFFPIPSKVRICKRLKLWLLEYWGNSRTNTSSPTWTVRNNCSNTSKQRWSHGLYTSDRGRNQLLHAGDLGSKRTIGSELSTFSILYGSIIERVGSQRWGRSSSNNVFAIKAFLGSSIIFCLLAMTDQHYG